MLRPIGSKDPVGFLPRPDLDGAPYTLEQDVQGALVVIETGTLLIMGMFRQDMRDIAEDMRDRLIIRHLAMRCPSCGEQAISVSKTLDGPGVYTHQDGTEHRDLSASWEKP